MLKFKNIATVVFASLFLRVGAQERPKLVVGIVVDQMRYDYVYRYWKHYGDNGIKRLVNDGYFCKNANFNYVPTYTGPGHASIFTGSTPAVHGIISNIWYDKQTGKNVYCVGDTAVKPIGTESPVGLMSPKRMLTTTIGDELLLSSNNRSKVIGISLKDRAAILPAGHSANGAYWLSGAEGKFITSSHYDKELPKWVADFNAKGRAAKLMQQTWRALMPLEQYSESYPDHNAYEGAFPNSEQVAFPYDLSKLEDLNHIKSTPFGNTLLREFAYAAIEGEQLGKDAFPDLLAISFSSPDYVGHQFGPMSVECEDTYIRFDKEIETLIDYLDKEIGKDEYVLFLTADHGAVNVPQLLKDRKIPANYFNKERFIVSLNRRLAKNFQEGEWVSSFSNLQFFLNYELIEAQGVDVDELKKLIVDFALTREGVAYAITAEQMLVGDFANPFLELVQMGFYQKRSGDIILTLEPGWIGEPMPKGTTHGAPYSYDTHVPLLWYGKNIPKGATTDYIPITDIAPTVSMMLNIQFPNGCVGKPIKQLTE